MTSVCSGRFSGNTQNPEPSAASLPPNPVDFYDLTLDELTQVLASWGHPPFRARQLTKWLYHKGATDFAQMTDLSRAFRQELAQSVHLYPLPVENCQVSADGSRKFLWRLADGEFIESVLIPEEGHCTLCLSSQVGCALGCRFCLTAQRGFTRNLSPGEIVKQVLAGRRHLPPGKPLTNLVFMGMGEPLANFAALTKALTTITAPWGLNFSTRRVTVSTVGLAPFIPRLGEVVPVNLTLSLNAPDDDTRTFLMPINRTYPLGAVLDACRAFPRPRHRRITFAYVLIDGINDALSQARDLARLLRGFKAKINLIPLNRDPRLDFAPPPQERMLAFQDILRRAHYPVFIRESRGQDIAAACGQLVGASPAP